MKSNEEKIAALEASVERLVEELGKTNRNVNEMSGALLRFARGGKRESLIAFGLIALVSLAVALS